MLQANYLQGVASPASPPPSTLSLCYSTGDWLAAAHIVCLPVQGWVVGTDWSTHTVCQSREGCGNRLAQTHCLPVKERLRGNRLAQKQSASYWEGLLGSECLSHTVCQSVGKVVGETEWHTHSLPVSDIGCGDSILGNQDIRTDNTEATHFTGKLFC